VIRRRHIGLDYLAPLQIVLDRRRLGRVRIHFLEILSAKDYLLGWLADQIESASEMHNRNKSTLMQGFK
jgi:hypothetical protein